MKCKLLFVLLPLVFSSCLSVMNYKIQVLEPAESVINPIKNNVLIINRTINENKDPIISQNIKITQNLYNLTTTDIIFSLAEKLNESPGIEFINESRMLEMQGTGIIPDTLPSVLVNYLSDSLDVKTVISLENFSVEYFDTIMLIRESSNSSEMLYQAQARLYTDSFWRIYSGESGGLIDEYHLSDTINWKHETNDAVKLSRLFFPTIEDMMNQAGKKTTMAFAGRISPNWIEQERKFFTGNYKFRVAAYYINNNQLDEAEKIYTQLLSGSNATMVAAASYNLAFIHELRGNFTQAHLWARRAYLHHKKPLFAEYIEILEDRITKSNILDRQLGVNR